MSEFQAKKEFQIAFRMSQNDFVNEADANKCFEYLEKIDNKSKFYKKAIIDMTLALAEETNKEQNEEAEKDLDQLFQFIKVFGLKKVLKNLSNDSQQSGESLQIKEDDAKMIADILANVLEQKGIFLAQSDKENISKQLEENEVNDLFDM